MSTDVRMALVGPVGLMDEKEAATSSEGIFTFAATPGKKYRIYISPLHPVKTSRITVETASGNDINVGDMVYEECQPAPFRFPGPPSSPRLLGNLTLDQIIIEAPQQPPKDWGWKSIPIPPGPDSATSALIDVEHLPCSIWQSFDNRKEWEGLCNINFNSLMSVESFVGGEVKTIRVIHFDTKLTPSEIRAEVRKAWLSTLSYASCFLNWSEPTPWNIEAIVEYEDGKQSSIVIDPWMHVKVQDREGKYWFARLWPGVE